jgi:hypothetical protein
MTKRVLIVAVTTIVLAVSLSTAATAKPDRLLATPANVCQALVDIRPDLYSSFGQCAGRLNRDVAAYRFPDNPEDPNSPLLSLSERCAQFEQGLTDPETGEEFKLTYPFFFVEGWELPEYWAQNRNQCENTLYAYHRFVGI